VSLLLTFVASLGLGAATGVYNGLIGNLSTRSGKTITAHMVKSSALEALDGEHRRVNRPRVHMRWALDRSKSGRSRASTAAIRTNSSDMSKTTTTIALLTAISALNSQTRAFGLNVADAATAVALLGGDSPRRGTVGGLVSGLAAVVAQALVRRTRLRNVTEISTLETTFPCKSHLRTLSSSYSTTYFSLFVPPPTSRSRRLSHEQKEQRRH